MCIRDRYKHFLEDKSPQETEDYTADDTGQKDKRSPEVSKWNIVRKYVGPHKRNQVRKNYRKERELNRKPHGVPVFFISKGFDIVFQSYHVKRRTDTIPVGKRVKNFPYERNDKQKQIQYNRWSHKDRIVRQLLIIVSLCRWIYIALFFQKPSPLKHKSLVTVLYMLNYMACLIK